MSSNQNRFFLTSAASALAAALILSSTPALAQVAPGQAGSQTGTRATAEAEPAAPTPGDAGITQAQADTGPGDGEIIVTAQKRAERLIEVPLAVTAVGGDALASRQINDSNSLTQAVPSLTYQQGANPTNTSFRIRGVGTSLFGQGVESSVSVVVDGVVAARQAQGFAEFADIERVEVLRGPQGTLFGKNSTAGVINVVTARPSRNFGGRGDVTIAEDGEYRAKGTVTGPISDTLRARLTGYYSKVGGYVRNITTNRDVQGSEGYGIRGKLEWDATDTLNILFSGDYRKQNSDCCASVAIRIVNPIVAAVTQPVVASAENRQVSENVDTYANNWQWTGSMQADLDLGSASITSITAYQKYYLTVNQPIDRFNSSQVLYLGPVALAPYTQWDLNAGRLKVKNFSEELRIASSGNRAFTYVAGLFFNHSDVLRPFVRRRAQCVAGTLLQPCATANIRYQSGNSIANLVTDSYAAFGQAELKIVGGLKAIGGLRAQYENGSNTGTQFGPTTTGDLAFPGQPYRAAGPNTGTAKAHDTAITGKAGLQYEFTRNAQTYATYTRGYKGVGYNMEATTDFTNQTILSPEHADAYEVGFKYSTDDRTFSLNAAAFLADYRNLQVQANRSDPATGVINFVTTNAGKSRAKGFELESVLRPSDNLTLNASFTYADSTVSIDGLNCPIQQQLPAPVVTGTVPFNTCVRSAAGATPFQNLRGAPLPASPKYRVVLSPRYDREISNDLAAFVQAGLNFQSKQNFTLEQDPLAVQEAYALVDMSIGVRNIDDRWNVTLFVKNLFDVNYYTSIGHNALLSTTTNPNDIVATFNKDADRYFGATVGFRF